MTLIIRFKLTAGQHSEIKQANSLIEGFSASDVVADKGYDADAFIVAIETGEAAKEKQKNGK